MEKELSETTSNVVNNAIESLINNSTSTGDVNMSFDGTPIDKGELIGSSNSTTTFPVSITTGETSTTPLMTTALATTATTTAITKPLSSSSPSSAEPISLTQSSSSTVGGGVDLIFHQQLNNENAGQPQPFHNYRHSRAYRHFKNPPQPHMCIRVTTVAGEELFINVLSWTRIVIPQEPSDPIPLYGGMRVPPGSPRCPPLVYAVMANPEVLKDSGRHSKDPEERRAMVELMCDFVEAMNPDVKLTRNAIILKDRDISGELKDVWNAVQAQRDREREEQLSQQQMHFPNMTHTTQQIFAPKGSQQSPGYYQRHPQQHAMQMQPHNTDNKVLYMDFGPETAANNKNEKQVQSSQENIKQVHDNNSWYTQSAIKTPQLNDENNENISKVIADQMAHEKDSEKQTDSDKDVTDAVKSNNENISVERSNSPANEHTNSSNINKNSNNILKVNKISENIPGITAVSPANTTTCAGKKSNNSKSSSISNVANTTVCPSVTTTVASTATITTNATNPTKKEKLAGFLPNGCHSIFPSFKSKKKTEKEKDKEKEKEKDKDKEKDHSKEKTLLNTFKKSTAAAANVLSKSQSDETKGTHQYEKGCMNLNTEMEKLDLGKIDSTTNEVIFKMKVASSGAK